MSNLQKNLCGIKSEIDPKRLGAEIGRRWDLVEAIENDGVAAEVLASYWIKISGKKIHASDCSTSSSPAFCPGPCDCEDL